VERLDIQRGRVGPLGHDWLDESEVVHIERPFGGIGWATSKYGGGDGPAGLTVEHEEDRMPKSDRRDVATVPIRLIQTPTRYRMSHRTEGKSARKHFWTRTD
jgi:hypothetical protein